MMPSPICLEGYLEPCRTYAIECLSENSQRLYFRKIASSQMFDWILNTPLYVSLNINDYIITYHYFY